VTGSTDFDEIAVERHGTVVEIRLDRPDQRNPISARDGGTRDQILVALVAAEDDPEVGCAVLTGAGTAFSAGGDLTGKPRETAEEHAAFLAKADAFHVRVRDSKVPVIAAVHGFCLGAALTLVASCDIVLAAESATFGLPEGRLGLVGASSLVPVIGAQWAKFLILTGESIDARRARQIGLVLTVEPDALLRERAIDLATRIARMPRQAVLLNRRAVDAVADAAGGAAGRAAGLTADTDTLIASKFATAPDGRTFREIVAAEGVAGLKQARAAQYESPWLSPDK
jgi:enoyl-CoA hydratase/carnithine racemase